MKNRPARLRLRHGECLNCKYTFTTIREFAGAVAGVAGHVHGIYERCPRCGALHITVAGRVKRGGW